MRVVQDLKCDVIELPFSKQAHDDRLVELRDMHCVCLKNDRFPASLASREERGRVEEARQQQEPVNEGSARDL
jgi:hypothetical protein